MRDHEAGEARFRSGSGDFCFLSKKGQGKEETVSVVLKCNFTQNVAAGGPEDPRGRVARPSHGTCGLPVDQWAGLLRWRPEQNSGGSAARGSRYIVEVE